MGRNDRSRSRAPLVPTGQLEAIIRRMPEAFTILEFSDTFQDQFPGLWETLVERYGLYGSGTRYSALTYLSNRLSAYSRRKKPGLLEPTPTGWKPEEGRYLRRTSREERERFGSPWIVIYHKRQRGEDNERREETAPIEEGGQE